MMRPGKSLGRKLMAGHAVTNQAQQLWELLGLLLQLITLLL